MAFMMTCLMPESLVKRDALERPRRPAKTSKISHAACPKNSMATHSSIHGLMEDRLLKTDVKYRSKLVKGDTIQADNEQLHVPPLQHI